MEPVTLTVAATAAIIGGVSAFAFRAKRRWHGLLRQLARERSWHFVAGGVFRVAKVVGREEARTLTVTTTSDGNTLYTRIDVEGPFDGVELVRGEGISSRVKKVFSGPDVSVGIPDFDAAIELRGDPRAVLARLDGEGRERVSHLVKDSNWSLIEGKMSVTRSGYIKTFPELDELTRRLSAVAACLDAQVSDDDMRLGESVATGPTAANRLACFLHLQDPTRRMAAAESLLADAAPLNRLEAGIALARPRVIGEALGYALPVEARMRGLEALFDLAPAAARESLRAFLGEHAAGLAEGLQLAATWTASGVRVMSPEEMLSFAENTDLETAQALVAWAVTVGVEAEPVLLRLLAHLDDGVATIAAKALGSVATLTAVHPLMTRSEGVLRASALKSAAKAAIAAIQARHSGAEAGGLTVADALDTGGLGLVDGD